MGTPLSRFAPSPLSLRRFAAAGGGARLVPGADPGTGALAWSGSRPSESGAAIGVLGLGLLHGLGCARRLKGGKA